MKPQYIENDDWKIKLLITYFVKVKIKMIISCLM
jgi:hypothetical protein